MRTTPYAFTPAQPRTLRGSPPTSTARRGYPPVTWSTMRHTARWREDEMQVVADLSPICTRVTIARRLGRTPRAVEAVQTRRAGLRATQQTYLTARQAAFAVGVSHTVFYRWMARGDVSCHRIPGGRWWLVADQEVDRIRRERAEGYL